jgi:hypothetical protein
VATGLVLEQLAMKIMTEAMKMFLVMGLILKLRACSITLPL